MYEFDSSGGKNTYHAYLALYLISITLFDSFTVLYKKADHVSPGSFMWDCSCLSREIDGYIKAKHIIYNRKHKAYRPALHCTSTSIHLMGLLARILHSLSYTRHSKHSSLWEERKRAEKKKNVRPAAWGGAEVVFEGFSRGCGMRTQLEELKGGQREEKSGEEGMGVSHTHLQKRSDQSTGVAHLGLWVSPLAK